MIRFLAAALLLALGAGQAVAQSSPQQGQAPAPPRTYTQAELWDRGSERISFRLARISFPVELGPTRLTQIGEASRQGQGLDNALLYYSPGQRIFATIYVYAPALADAALTAFTTGEAIRIQSGPGLRLLSSATGAAGGRDGVAFRADYAGFRQDRLASSAAYLKVGHWIVKLRVSGPEADRSEVERTMTALLRDMRFEGEAVPRPFQPIAVEACAGAPGRAAQRQPADAADTMEDSIMNHRVGNDTPPVGTGWCRSPPARGARAPLAILRATAPATGDDTRRSVLIALINDAGTMIEVAERRFRGRTRFVMLHHQVGQTMILGSYDAVPTDAQLVDILSGADREGGRARATIQYEAEGNSAIQLLVPLDPPAPRT